MIVTYEPEQSKSGLTSILGWDNPDLHAALNQAFRVDQKHERIADIEVTKQGIKAIFETLPRKAAP
jgi:hypothetical protein